MIDVRVGGWRWPGSHCCVKRAATRVVTAADTAAACHGHCVRAAQHSLLCATIAEATKCAARCAPRAYRRAANAMAADHSQNGAAAAGGERHAKRLTGTQHHHAELVLHAARQMLGAPTQSNRRMQLTTSPGQRTATTSLARNRRVRRRTRGAKERKGQGRRQPACDRTGRGARKVKCY
jgi:hypothetical protein